MSIGNEKENDRDYFDYLTSRIEECLFTVDDYGKCDDSMEIDFHISKILKRYPDYGVAAVRHCIKDIHTEKDEAYGMSLRFNTLSTMAKFLPSLTNDVVSVMKYELASEVNDDYSLRIGLEDLFFISENCRSSIRSLELAKNILTAYEVGVTNKKNNGHSLYNGCECLKKMMADSWIFKENPGLAENGIEVLGKGMISEKNTAGAKLLKSEFCILSDIVSKRWHFAENPSFVEKVVDISKVMLANKNNDSDSLDMGYNVLLTILMNYPQYRKCPELMKKVEKAFGEGMANENNSKGSLDKIANIKKKLLAPQQPSFRGVPNQSCENTK